MDDVCYAIFKGPFWALKKSSTHIYRNIVYIIFLLLPNIVDFILTLLDYSDKIRNYFIIRFITQLLFIYYSITFVGLISYSSHDGIDGLIPFIPFCLMLVIILALEITSLVLYIKGYDDIQKLARVGYYVHFSHIPFIFIGRMVVFGCNRNDW